MHGNRPCQGCGKNYLVSDGELSFLKRLSPKYQERVFELPVPIYCPACREQQRLAFRNERCLYKRRCEKSDKDVVSIYAPDSSYTVYAQDIWWSDEYDPLEYGREFDFSYGFFEQFKELNLAVPKLAIQNAKSENCDYTNYSCENKNCYLAVGTGNSEDCYYCYRVTNSKDVCDSYDLQKCELCYECLQSTELYSCQYCNNCHNSSDLRYSENCIGCRNCFGCTNLRNQSWCIFNEPLSEKEYKNRLQALLADQGSMLASISDVKKSAPSPTQYILNCEDCTGDQLIGSKDCVNCFTLKGSKDCLYTGTGENNRDCLDCNFTDNCELQYCSSNLEANYNVIFCSLVWYTKESAYLTNCFNSQYLFGCSGMKKNEYCVLNKQYSKSDYMTLVPKIIEHMMDTGEWGLFFPIHCSPFAYNESAAQEYYPVKRQVAIENGYPWKDKEKDDLNLTPYVPPRDIKAVSDSITKEVLCCSESSQHYRIIAQELEFYRRLGISIPTKCPDVRHQERMQNVKRAISLQGDL